MAKQTEHREDKYLCNLCDYEATNAKGLVHHNNVKHLGMTNNCDLCDWVAVTASSLRNHQNFKHKGISFDCPECDYKASNSKYLGKHRKQHASCIATEHSCKYCDYKAAKKGLVRAHEGSMHENKWASCDQCDYKHASNLRIKQHKESKHLGIKYDCNHCAWSGPTVAKLKHHTTNKHTASDTVYCDQCDFKSIDQSRLNYHNKIKHLEITHKCYRCGKGPMSKLSLVRHTSRVHGEFKQCDQCDFKSKNRATLKYHNESKHQGIIYECSECGKGGLTKVALMNHKYDFHGKFTKCFLCDYKTRRKENIKIHTQAIHEGVIYPCDMCGYKTSTTRSLSLHKKSVH